MGENRPTASSVKMKPTQRAGPSHVSRRWRERCSERGSARWCLPEMVKRRFKKSFERWLRGFFVHWHKCEVPTGPEIVRLCPTSALLNYLPSILLSAQVLRSPTVSTLRNGLALTSF